MNDFIRLYLIVCPLVFLGGFVDSVAGGGGLITLPAYLMAGLPTHMAMGTNKVVNAIGTGTAAFRYLNLSYAPYHKLLGIHSSNPRSKYQIPVHQHCILRKICHFQLSFSHQREISLGHCCLPCAVDQRSKLC